MPHIKVLSIVKNLKDVRLYKGNDINYYIRLHFGGIALNINYISKILMLIIIGGIGAIVALKIKIPSGAFIGPIVFIGVYQILNGNIIEKPYWLKLIAQLAVGMFLGTRFTREFLASSKKLVKPIIIACSTLISGAVILGIILKNYTGWDYITSILATVPGGQAEMAMLSDNVGAQTEKVILLQLLRNQFTLLFMLPMAKLFIKYKEKRKILS